MIDTWLLLLHRLIGRVQIALVFLVAFWICCIPIQAEMHFPGKEWQEGTPESQDLNSDKLAEAIDYLKVNSGRDGVRELVILRNGIMVWHGDNIDKVHGVWSMTKSYTSTVLGLLIDNGKAALDTPAYQFVPELKKTYPDVTLRHFTTMTSGYRAKGDEPRGTYTHGPSLTPFIPNSTPLFAPPGSKFAYWDSAMNEFGYVLTNIAKESMKDLFKRRIADPIGMNPKQWNWGDFGKIDGLVVNGGSGNNNNHVFISAREAARFGLLFLNRGNWAGKQLISKGWVDQCHAVYVKNTVPLGHLESHIDGRGVYGFNWWTNGIMADGKRKWVGAPASTYDASGYNNNDMFVIPDWNMVVVRLGLDQNDKAIGDGVYGKFLEKIGASMN